MGSNVEFDLQQYLTDMESRLTVEMRIGFGDVKQTAKGIEDRVRKLESSRSYLLGAWAAVSLIGGGIAEWLTHLFKAKP